MLTVIVKKKERTDSRASMVRGAVSLIRTRGVNATSFSDVLAKSGAPRGSIYYHFPKGKEQLAGDAIRWTSERVLAHQRACRATTPAGVLDCFIDMWRQVVVASGGTAGCVVAGVAIDTTADDRTMIDLVRATFRSWVDLLTEQLASVGVPSRRASRVAVAVVAGMEGALILCRAEGNSGPLETVAAELKRLLAAQV
ncbi:MAG TPA: TetR/AcrR family transcriptional regulator [Candidatus Limnocylindria bacterium]|jgi:AcrR family transcriptional regulator